jgi:hypothetical protein
VLIGTSAGARPGSWFCDVPRTGMCHVPPACSVLRVRTAADNACQHLLPHERCCFLLSQHLTCLLHQVQLLLVHGKVLQLSHY